MAKGSIIGALRVKLGMDAADFETGAGKAKATARGLKGELSSLAAGFSPVVAGAAIGTAAVAALTLGFQKAKEAADFADDLAAAAYKIGTTAESLQELRHAAEANDIPVEKLDEGLRALNASIGALQTGVGAGKLKKALAELNIPPEALKNINSADELLPILAEHINQLGSYAEKVKLAKAFGVEELLPLLMQGADGIAKFREEARTLGLVMSEDVVNRLADMNEQMRIADERAKMAGRGLGAALTPALVTLKNHLADAYNWMAKFIDRFNAIESRASDGLRRERAYEVTQRTKAAMNGDDYAKKLHDGRIAAIDTELGARFDAASKMRAEAPPPATATGHGLVSGGSKNKKGREVTALPAPLKAGDVVDPEALARLADKGDFNDFKEGLKQASRDGLVEGANAAIAASRENVRESYRWAISRGLEAAIYGGGKGLMQYLADTLRERLIDRLADGLAAAFEQISFSNNGGGGVMATALNFGSKIFGFASGGSGRVGGSGGVDSQLVNLKLTPGELVDVRRPGDDIGGGLGGLVVTVDKSDYFDVAVQRVAAPMAAQAAAYGEHAGAQRAQQSLMRRSRQRLG